MFHPANIQCASRLLDAKSTAKSIENDRTYTTYSIGSYSNYSAFVLTNYYRAKKINDSSDINYWIPTNNKVLEAEENYAYNFIKTMNTYYLRQSNLFRVVGKHIEMFFVPYMRHTYVKQYMGIIILR